MAGAPGTLRANETNDERAHMDTRLTFLLRLYLTFGTAAAIALLLCS